VDNDAAHKPTVYGSSIAQGLSEYQAATIAAVRELGCRCLTIEEERRFADQWLHSMRSRVRPSAASCYDPPPNGLTGLAGSAGSGSRIFAALRDRTNSPYSQGGTGE
jgi:hypothetical protein